MAISIKDLVKDLSREDILGDFLEVAKALGLATTAWQPGEPIRLLLTVIADVLASLWNGPIVKSIRAGFLDYAEGDWLTLLAWTDYNLFRRDATYATGTL